MATSIAVRGNPLPAKAISYRFRSGAGEVIFVLRACARVLSLISTHGTQEVDHDRDSWNEHGASPAGDSALHGP